MIALLLQVVPLPIVPRILLILVLLGVFCIVGFRVQLHSWGTLFAPAFTSARVSLSVFIGAMSLLLSYFPVEASSLWRTAAMLALPAAFFALARWDDACTVELLRSRRSAQHDPLADSPSSV